MSASAGFGWNILMRRTQGKWALYNTLTTRHYATKSHFVEVNQSGPFYTVDRTLTLALNHIMLSSAARYQIKGKKVTPFFYVGITAGLGFGGERNDHRITYFGSDATIEDRRLTELYRTFDLGPVFGAGLTYKRVSLETRWTTGKGPSSNIDVRSPTSTFYIWAGYRINS